MSLRTRISIMISAFVIIIAIFATGTLLIFDKLSANLNPLRTMSEENKHYNDLDRSIGDVTEAVKHWSQTEDYKYKKVYYKRLSDAKKVFRSLDETRSGDPDINFLEKQFEDLIDLTKPIISSRSPIGDAKVAAILPKIDVLSLEIITRIDDLQEKSINKVVDFIKADERIRKEMISYHVSLILISMLIALLLALWIRRTMSEPFNQLLKATERIGTGDLSYRIRMKRTDEFGTIASRFDEMVSDLEASSIKLNRKLAETELYLYISTIAGTSLNIQEALHMICATVADKLGYDICSVYLRRSGQGSFCIAASCIEGSNTGDFCLTTESSLVSQLSVQKTPLVLEAADARTDELKLGDGYESLIAVPVMQEGETCGFLLAGRKAGHFFSYDEINTLKISSHTIGSFVSRTELYESTKNQLGKLSVLYELSKEVTSVLDLEELLKKIAAEMAKLLSAKGCLIRLLENNTLVIKSEFGLHAGSREDMSVPIGAGIAGRVAASGEPRMVDDMHKLSDDMQIPHLDAKTVLCVPLKVRGTVIGTLGLYDKHDADGNVIPFSKDDLDTAEGFASISAIAIEKSSIYENEVRREREASEAGKRLDILFNSVQGGVITLNRDFVIVSVNRYVEEWTGIPAGELIGKSSIDVFHDKIGICPHCAAKATFETGDRNSIMQSRGVNYAELTAYPIKDETGAVAECVVFVQDITERVLYQEETLSLYREVIQTKEYLESIIDNSADAIVTSDMEGIITSWNKGAEKIFGYTEAEAMGKFLPFVPEFLLERERDNIEKIRRGEVLRDVETFRLRKDGTMFEASLSLSPIKDASGLVIGISGISRDISEKKAVEKELVRRNQELSRLFFISSAMRGTLDLDKLLRMVLVAVTMSDGMGFNRAILFLVDESKDSLKGAMGVGPASPEDAWRIWDELSFQRKTLDDIMMDVISKPLEKDTFLDRLSMGIEISLNEDNVLTRAVNEKKSVNVASAGSSPLNDAILVQQLGTEAYAVVPLISRDKVIGLIWVDNYFTRKKISEEDMQFLVSFSNHVASAIENARLFEQVKMTEQRLENIFESMSDMVYFNNREYVIQSVNKAVCSRLGLGPSEIIGRKCYEVFHGMNEPWKKCPHHKTVTTKKAYIEELEDPNLGGTFLTSSSPIFDLSGEYIGSVHVVRDITEIKDLQEKLTVTEKMAALGEVAAKVAHEIRNPLVSVGGFAKRLENKLDGNLKEYAGIIVKEVERLEGILKEILGFVKEVRLARETIDINVLVEDVFNVMKTEMAEKGINVFKQYGPSAMLFVDPNRVKEAIMNILTNAIQSLPGAGGIYVRTYQKDSNAVVEIEDTGRGISDKDRQFIFNPFFTTKLTGTGLGLAITHRIIQEHGGKIDFESEMDKGSIFRVYIPLKEGES